MIFNNFEIHRALPLRTQSMAERWGSARQLAPRITSQPVPTSGIDSGPFLPPPRSCSARRILNQRYHALFALLHSPGQPLNVIRGLVCLQETISLGGSVGWRIRIDHSLQASTRLYRLYTHCLTPLLQPLPRCSTNEPHPFREITGFSWLTGPLKLCCKQNIRNNAKLGGP